MQQGLLVDFTLFPTKLIDLLEQCLSEAGKDNPRWVGGARKRGILVGGAGKREDVGG